MVTPVAFVRGFRAYQDDLVRKRLVLPNPERDQQATPLFDWLASRPDMVGDQFVELLERRRARRDDDVVGQLCATLLRQWRDEASRRFWCEQADRLAYSAPNT